MTKTSFWNRIFSRTKTSSRTKSLRRRIFLEPLEPRIVLDGDPTGITAALNGNQLIVEGTTANDTILIDESGGSVRVWDNGNLTFTCWSAAVASTYVTGGAGNDTIDSSPFSGNVVIHGEGGDDVLTAGSGLDWLDGGEGDDSLQAGFGNDTLIGGPGLIV